METSRSLHPILFVVAGWSRACFRQAHAEAKAGLELAAMLPPQSAGVLRMQVRANSMGFFTLVLRQHMP